jgi:hypothetical protein
VVSADWSTVFRRSTVHPAVFAVRDPAVADDLVAWAGRQNLAHRHQAYAFSAELDGWALLDGGLSYLRSRASGRLRSGLRVIGWSTLRLLIADLGLVAPRRLLVGEPARHPDAELRRLAEQGWVAQGPPSRQATLLVSYVDARGLSEIASTLVGLAVPASNASQFRRAQ